MALMASQDEQLLAAAQSLLRLTKQGRVQWRAPYGGINETVQTSTPRTTFSISPLILGSDLEVELYDSEGVKVLAKRVSRGNLLGDTVIELYQEAHSTVFQADKVLDNLLENLKEE
jgi:hypothetical protein